MYKPVLPSSLLSKRDEKQSSFSNRLFNNNGLKMGVVLEVLDLEHEENKSDTVVEYHVMAIEQEASFGINSTIYKNCVAVDSFGGIADFFQFTRRAPLDKETVKKDADINNQEGTIVLMLCLDGNAEKAIIIGQLPNPSRKINLDKEKEHHAEGEFNGLRYSVDKDGAFTITFKGATDEDGIPATPASAGSQIKIEADGSLELNDAPIDAELAGGNRKDAEAGEAGEGGDEIVNEKIRIDRTAMQIIMEAQSDITVNTGANLAITAKENTNITCVDLVLMCEGKVEITSDAAVKIEATAALEMKGASVTIESDADMTMKASMFTIDAPLIALGQGGTPAVTLMTKFMGVGFAGVPVVSSAIGPFSVAVTIA